MLNIGNFHDEALELLHLAKRYIFWQSKAVQWRKSVALAIIFVWMHYLNSVSKSVDRLVSQLVGRSIGRWVGGLVSQSVKQAVGQLRIF